MRRKSVSRKIHVHPAWFGSEYACPICNPACWQYHSFGKKDNLKFCGNEGCPLNPNRMSDYELRKVS